MMQAEHLEKKSDPLKQLKRLFLVIILLALGGLLTLAGYNLIAFSPDLLKYSGVGLLSLGIVYYLIY